MAYKHLITGKGNFIGKGSDKIAIINGLNNVVHPGASSIILLNTSGRTTTPRDNGFIFYNNAKILSSAWTTLSASSVYEIYGKEGDKYLIDATSGDISMSFDFASLKDTTITIKITNATNNLIMSATTSLGTENFNGRLLPYTMNLKKNDVYQISSDGTNLHLINRYTEQTYANLFSSY